MEEVRARRGDSMEFENQKRFLVDGWVIVELPESVRLALTQIPGIVNARFEGRNFVAQVWETDSNGARAKVESLWGGKDRVRVANVRIAPQN